MGIFSALVSAIGRSKRALMRDQILRRDTSSGQADSRAGVVQEAFRQYIESVFEYLRSSEACLAKGWPDKKETLRNAFRVQELSNQCTGLRLEHLIREWGSGDARWRSFSSISSIWDRLHGGWLDFEEEALNKSNQVYRDILSEIEDRQRTVDATALDGLFRDAQRDSEYLAARRTVQQKLRELDDQL
jgi:hypothetical protein